jgi:hypothetical protein
MTDNITEPSMAAIVKKPATLGLFFKNGLSNSEITRNEISGNKNIHQMYWF